MNEYIIAALNSNAIIGAVVGIVAYYLMQQYNNRMTSGGDWEKYRTFITMARPYIVSAVKFAEERIPDNTPNKAAAKADVALKYALVLLEHGKVDSPIDYIRRGIIDIHEELEEKKKLPLRAASSDEPSLSKVEPELPELS